MADPTSTFVLELDDETSGAAESAAKSLEKLKETIDGNLKELRAMQAAMKNLKAASSPNVAQINQLQKAINAQKEVIAQAQSKWLQLGGSFRGAGGAAKASTGGLKGLADVLQKMPGPVSGLGARLGSLSKLLGVGGPLVLGLGAVAAAVAAVVVALGAIAAATGAATVALLRYGVAQADARRSELLRLEGLTTIRRWQGLAAGSATELQASIDRVSASVAAGRGEVAGYAEQLYRMGLRGQDLQDALEGVAITTQVQGERMGRRFAGMAAAAVRTGRSVRGLADDVRRRLGGIAARQLLSLEVQSRKLHESFAAIFSGLRIEGFLRGLSRVAELFSQNTASGRALKQLAEVVFQPMLDALELAGPLSRRFVQGAILGLQAVTIQALRLAIWLRQTFGGTELPAFIRQLDLAQAALVTGAAAAALFVGVLAAIVGLTAAAAVGFVSLFTTTIAAGVAFYEAFQRGREFAAFLATTDFATLGRSLVDGLIEGIRSRVDSLRAEVQNLAATARGALERALQIASPSRVFARLGVEIPRGLAQGIDAGAPEASASLEDMVSPSDVAAPQSGTTGATSAPTSSTSSVTIGELHIHTQAEDPQGVAEDFRDQLVRVLEGLQITMGAAPEAAT